MSSETLTAESAPTDHPVGHAHPGDKQYVVIAAGGGKLGTPSGDSYIAFALP